jgi:hypothetical protein
VSFGLGSWSWLLPAGITNETNHSLVV